jgi:hypothetical protein
LKRCDWFGRSEAKLTLFPPNPTQWTATFYSQHPRQQLVT